MKESIQILKQKLEKYPTARCKIESDSIEVLPESNDGFPVTLYDCGEEQIVSYGGWHEHFKDKDAALNCFVFGLSTMCRLKVFARGTFEHKWTVQSLVDGEWKDMGTTGLMFYPYWKPKSVKYLQNQLWAGNITN